VLFAPWIPESMSPRALWRLPVFQYVVTGDTLDYLCGNMPHGLGPMRAAGRRASMHSLIPRDRPAHTFRTSTHVRL